MSIENCSDSLDALFSLIEEVKLGYQEPTEAVRRGRKPTFSNLSFLLLAVVAVVTKTFSDSELHPLLSKDTALRETLEFPRVPHRAAHFATLETACANCRRTRKRRSQKRSV